MKNLIFTLFAVLGASTLSEAQTTVARWTFESSFAGITGSGTSLSGISPEIGSGSASGIHASSATTWSSPAGNGSAHSFSANTWAVGDYYQFQVSTLGLSGIGIAYDQISSSTGPGIFTLAYSTDGSSFAPVAMDYAVIVNSAPNAWSSSVGTLASSYAYNLSSVPALNNAATVYFRLMDDSTTSAGGGVVAVAGTDRIDNFAVFSPAPEPSTLAVSILGAVLAAASLRRKR